MQRRVRASSAQPQGRIRRRFFAADDGPIDERLQDLPPTTCELLSWARSQNRKHVRADILIASACDSVGSRCTSERYPPLKLWHGPRPPACVVSYALSHRLSEASLPAGRTHLQVLVVRVGPVRNPATIGTRRTTPRRLDPARGIT